MITRRERPTHLRVVAGHTQDDKPRLSWGGGTQQTLFSLPKPNAIVLVYGDALGRRSLGHLLETIRPQWVFDLRAAPRFDGLAASRHDAFRLFAAHSTEYVDLFGAAGIRSHKSADANLAFLSETINGVLENARDRSSGPYVFLFDDLAYLENAAEFLPRALSPRPKQGFELCRIV